MQRYGVLYVADPIMSLDLSEMLEATLHPIEIRMPRSIEEANIIADDTTCIVTDKAGSLAMAAARPARTIPHLYIGSVDDLLYLTDVYACIEKPFTTATVYAALQQLDLVP